MRIINTNELFTISGGQQLLITQELQLEGYSISCVESLVKTTNFLEMSIDKVFSELHKCVTANSASIDTEIVKVDLA